VVGDVRDALGLAEGATERGLGSASWHCDARNLRLCDASQLQAYPLRPQALNAKPASFQVAEAGLRTALSENVTGEYRDAHPLDVVIVPPERRELVMGRSVLYWVCVFALIALPVGGCSDESSGGGSAGNGGSGSEVASDIDKAREATERYKSLQNAIEDGYGPNTTVPCIAHNGWRYSNLGYVLAALAAPPDIEKPVNLVYQREEDGEMILMAVEYIASGEGAAPVIFGHEMDGTFCIPNLPPLYALHVWLWKDNPDGMFEHVNSTVPADVCVTDEGDFGVPAPPYCATGLPPTPPWL